MSSRESWVTAGQLLGMLPSECSLCEWLTILLYTLEAMYHPLLAFQVALPTPRLLMCTWFHCWGSESWLPSLAAEQNRPMGPGVPPPSASCPLAYKSMDLEAHWGFPGQGHSAHVPIVQCWEKSILVWPRTRKVLEARDKPLWTPCCIFFPVAFVLYPLL